MLKAKVFNSLVKSENVTASERILGYFLGPIGVAVMNQCHLLKRKIIEIYPPSAIGLVYLRIYLKTNASRLTKMVLYSCYFS